MRITIFGAAGNVGSRVVSEAISRGHDVTAVVRDPKQFDKLPTEAKARSGDASNAEVVARLTAGQDVVVSAIRPPAGAEEKLATITKSILEGVGKSDVRVLIVGGAASLKMPGQNGTTVLTAPDFLPKAALDIARACFEQHAVVRAETKADWAYLSPPAMLTPGTRTGTFRLGRDELLVDENGLSAISMEDFAVALIDEAETPKHSQIRFTAAY